MSESRLKVGHDRDTLNEMDFSRTFFIEFVITFYIYFVFKGSSIWDKITSPEIMWGFIIVLFFISSVRVHQGEWYCNIKNWVIVRFEIQNKKDFNLEQKLSDQRKWQKFSIFKSILELYSWIFEKEILLKNLILILISNITKWFYKKNLC